jgi:hypothetical protein
LGICDQFTSQVAEVAISLSGACDPQVFASSARILAEIGREEAAFSATLSKGQKLLDDMLAAAAAAAAGSNGSSGQAVLAGADAFLLYDSFGFPLELTQVCKGGGVHARPGGGGAKGSSSRQQWLFRLFRLFWLCQMRSCYLTVLVSHWSSHSAVSHCSAVSLHACDRSWNRNAAEHTSDLNTPQGYRWKYSTDCIQTVWGI